jgi:hypothetical protein
MRVVISAILAIFLERPIFIILHALKAHKYTQSQIES